MCVLYDSVSLNTKLDIHMQTSMTYDSRADTDPDYSRSSQSSGNEAEAIEAIPAATMKKQNEENNDETMMPTGFASIESDVGTEGKDQALSSDILISGGTELELMPQSRSQEDMQIIVTQDSLTRRQLKKNTEEEESNMSIPVVAGGRRQAALQAAANSPFGGVSGIVGHVQQNSDGIQSEDSQPGRQRRSGLKTGVIRKDMSESGKYKHLIKMDPTTESDLFGFDPLRLQDIESNNGDAPDQDQLQLQLQVSDKIQRPPTIVT